MHLLGNMRGRVELAHVYEHDLCDEPFFGKDFFCEVCDRFCKTESELTAHKQQHIPNEVQISVTCNFCEKNFSTTKRFNGSQKERTC